MNREIKFRMWRDGSMQQLREMTTNEDVKFCFQKSEEFGVIMQYTGLLDKNGKEIYEGDIVLCHDHPTGVDDIKGEVYYEQGEWKINGALPSLPDYGTAWTLVVGNVYEK